MKEIENDFKTVRRICEDLQAIGVEATQLRVGVRLKSLRKYNLVDFKEMGFPIVGPKPIAYRRKA